MVFENIQESITNKNNTGIKNLRQGLVYNRNRKRTQLNVIEGFKEGVDQATIKKFKSDDPPTKPWLSSGPYDDGSGIMRKVGDTKQRIKLDDNGTPTTNPPSFENYKDEVRNYKGTFDDMRAKEYAQFDGALKKFNAAKEKYKTEYDVVATNYTGIQQNIVKCLSNCNDDVENIKIKTNGMEADEYKDMYKKFCKAGCTFNGPQLVNSCKDTWKGLKNKETDRTGNSYSAGATCAAFHPTCDKNNNMIMRNQHNSELLNYKDINGTLLKNGCCSCGGGAGGIPMAVEKSIFHKSCDSLKLHACGSDGSKCGNSASPFMAACKTPPMPPAGSSVSNTQLRDRLKKAYQKVVTNNNIMKDRGEFLFNKINTYDKQLNKLKNEKNNEEETYDQIISNYKKTRKDLSKMYGVADSVADGQNTDPNELYSLIQEQKLKMSKDWSRDVMVEESKLRRRSEEMHFWMWSILAIVVGWATIINFKKKVA
tara:strand:- start:517 stop:1959 length:1443 start_codon:yes stop_codon:yes gene_type:complete